MIKEITLEPGRCYSIKLHSPFKTKKGYEEFMSIIIALLKNNINVAFVNSFDLNKESKNYFYLNYSDICEHIKRYLRTRKMNVTGQLYMIDLDYYNLDSNNCDLAEIEYIINNQEYFSLTEYDVIIFENTFLFWITRSEEEKEQADKWINDELSDKQINKVSREIRSWAKCLGLSILGFYD